MPVDPGKTLPITSSTCFNFTLIIADDVIVDIRSSSISIKPGLRNSRSSLCLESQWSGNAEI